MADNNIFDLKTSIELDTILVGYGAMEQDFLFVC